MASDAAGIEVGDGIALRVILMFIVLVGMAIGYVLWYCRRITADPSRSIVRHLGGDASEARDLVEEVPPLTGRQKVILGIFFAAFAILIYGFVPWDDVMDTILEPTGRSRRSTSTSPRRRWLFLVAAVIIGLIGKLGEEGTVNAIVAGAGEFLGAALVIVLASGDGRDEGRRDHGHDHPLDRGRRERHVGNDLRSAGDDREPPDRVPGAVFLGHAG